MGRILGYWDSGIPGKYHTPRSHLADKKMAASLAARLAALSLLCANCSAMFVENVSQRRRMRLSPLPFN